MKSSNSIVPKGLIIVGIAIIAAMFVFSWYLYRIQSDEYRKDKSDELRSALDYKKSQLLDWRQDQQANAVMLAKDRSVEICLRRWLANKGDKAAYGELFSILENWKVHRGYDDVMLVDQNGNILMDVDRSDAALSDETKGQLLEPMHSGRPTLGDFYFCSIHQKPHIDVIVPLRLPDPARKHPGLAAILRVSPHAYLYPLMKNNALEYRTFETLLVRPEADSVLFLNELRFMTEAAMRLKVPLAQKEIAAARAVMGFPGPFEGIDYRGRRVLAVTSRVPDSDWYLVAKVETDEIYAPIKTKLSLIVTTQVLTIFLVLAVATLISINQRKEHYKELYRIESDRKALEKHYQYLTKYANDHIFVFNDNLRIVEINDKVLETYGYSKDELIGADAAMIRAEGQRSLLKVQMEKSLNNNGLVFETVHRRKDGSTFPVEISTRPVEIDGRFYQQGIVRDITERKRYEQELLDKNQEIQENFASLEALNQELTAAEEELRQNNDNLQTNYAELEAANEELLVSEEELKATDKELRQALEKLTISQQRYNELFQGINSGVAVFRAVEDGNDFVFVDFNRAGQNMEKISAEKVIGRKVTEVFPGIKPMGLLEVFQRVWRSGKSEQHPESLYQDGHLVKWRKNYVYKLPTGEVVSIYEDLTEIKQAEEKLMGNARLLNIAGNVAKLGGWSVDLKNNLCTWSNETAAIHERPAGYAPLVEEGISYYAPEWRDRITKAFTECAQNGRHYDEEMEIIAANGKRVWVRTIGEPVEDETGKIVKVQGAFQDITERKRAEEKLRESENNYRILADSGQALIWTAGTDKLCNYFNKVWLEFTGRTLEQELGNGWAEGVHSGDLQRCLDAYTAAFDRRASFSIEYRLRRHDGEYRWIRDDGSPRYNSAGEFVGYIGHCLDITEHKQIEEGIKESLLEKEVMLKEIHHRVKNNLQVITSLLNLQAGYVDDERYRQMFKESQDRVRSMAIVHEKLYKSENLARIDFSEYVDSLVRELYISYGITSSQAGWSTKINTQKMSLDMAVPCGLIISELVSNSLKHALPAWQREGRRGEINVSLRPAGEDRLVLEVTDNGPGIMQQSDSESFKTLGLQLIEVLTQQLAGNLSIDGENGMRVTINFQIREG